MSHTDAKWLKLQLKDGVSMKDVYLSVYTHFSIYSYCFDQGNTLSFYQDNQRRDAPKAVCYIKTDHDGFYESCFKYYSRMFDIEPLDKDFSLPKQYELAHGAAQDYQPASQSSASYLKNNAVIS